MLHVQAAGQMQVQQIVQAIQISPTVIARQEEHQQSAHIVAVLSVVLPTNRSVTAQNALHQTGHTAHAQIAAALTSLLATDRHAVHHQADHIAAVQKAAVRLTVHHAEVLTGHIVAALSVAKAVTAQPETALTANHH